MGEKARFWYRSSDEVDQTDIEELDGGEHLESLTSTIDEIGIADGASLLFEQCRIDKKYCQVGKQSSIEEITLWPFFKRQRIAHKAQQYKDPQDKNVRLAVDDQIDASVVTTRE